LNHPTNTPMPTFYINLEEERLKKELAQIKDAIKRCQGTFILDGNDMYDWGWTPTLEMNKKCYERYGFIPSEVELPLLTVFNRMAMSLPRFPCPLCKSNMNPIYMVHDDLWKQSGLTGCPCPLCFEKAIGRRLTINDLKISPLCNHDLPIGWLLGDRPFGKMS
jgi:hypothetical protein